MPIVDKRIYRIVSNSPASLSPKQTGIQATDDTDLGFKMMYWQDASAAVNYCLAKSQPGWLESLKCSEDLWLGDSKEVQLLYDTAQTPDALMLGLGAASNSLMICRKTDIGTDYGAGLFTDPTLIMKAAGTTFADRTEISHGLIHAFSGDFQINANNFIYDCDYDSLTYYAGGTLLGNVICGEDHDIYSQYTQYTAVFGQDNVINTNYGLIAGYQNNAASAHYSLVVGELLDVTNKYNVVGGYINNVSQAYNLVGGSQSNISGTHNLVGGTGHDIDNNGCAVGGSGHTVQNHYNAVFGTDITVTGLNNIAAGDDHSISGAYNAVFGNGNTVGSDGDYGLAFGLNNESNFEHTMVHGVYAKAFWEHARFFASASLAGSTAGDSQCWDTTMVCRHTEATDQVMLTPDGTGTDEPFAVPEGTHCGFLVSLHCAYEGAGNGYLHQLLFVVVSNSNSDIVRVDATTVATNSGGTYGFQKTWTYDETADTWGLNITPENAAAANIVAHFMGGTKLNSEQSTQ